MPKKAHVPPLTSGQALFVLEKLIDEKKVSAADIRRHLATMWSEMNFLEKRLSELRGAVEPLRHPVHAAKTATKRFKKSVGKAVSAERRASMKLQGQYLALLRRVPKSKRAAFQKLAKEKGREQAIAAMSKA